MATKNKVKYGLENVHYSIVTYDDTTKTHTYATPVAINGAVSISLSQSGSSEIFYADNSPYYTSISNTGYEGDLELALIDDTFRKDVLGELVDTNGFQYEVSDAKPKEIALLFQFSGDIHNKCHILYRCKVTRPDIAGSTTNDKISPETDKLKLTAVPRENDKLVKGSLSDESTSYSTFFTTVYEPVPVEPEG